MKRTWLIGALVLSACGPLPNEALRARLASGCQSDADCAAVVAEAEALKRACYDNRTIGYRCGDARADLAAAEQARDAFAAADRARAQIVMERQLALEAAKADAEAAHARQMAEWQRRKDAAAAEADRIARVAKERTELAARCEQDRQRRAEAASQRAAVEKIEAERRHAVAFAAAWAKSHCWAVKAPIYENRFWADAQGIVHVGRQIVDYEEYTACPKTTPDEIRRGGDMVAQDSRGFWIYEASDEPPPSASPSASAWGVRAAMGLAPDPACAELDAAAGVVAPAPTAPAPPNP